MATINKPPMPGPVWPWGGPRSVRERLIDRAQLDRKRALKKGDPRSPALASAALLDFIGPAHSSEELRLPMPPSPQGHDADLESFLDRPHLQAASKRAKDRQDVEASLGRLNAAPDRLDRMRALLSRESQMLSLVDRIGGEMQQILHLMWEAQKDEGI
ncbi:MAG TPA: hypothetical protein VND93_16665 [Myxococcales bacterium]|jgi:hypothetical protein|nr:hypothetical protein [Myxococcales bacterium]